MSYQKLSEFHAMENIADHLPEELLQEIGTKVVEDYNLDEDSRAEWWERNRDALRLAAQVVEPKSYPWPNASNVKYPILTFAGMKFQAKAYPALVKSGEPVRMRTIGSDPQGLKKEAAIRIERYLGYQLTYGMDSWEEDQDKALMVTGLIGDAFKKTYYDRLKGQVVSELVLPQDLAINYYARSLEQAATKTHILEYRADELEVMYRNGIYRKFSLDAYSEEKPDPQKREIENRDPDLHGIDAPSVVNESSTYKILEQHRYWDLDGDGLDEPYVVSVEESTKQVLAVVARYDMENVITSVENDDYIVRIEPNEHFTNYGLIPDAQSGVYHFGFNTLLGSTNDSVNTIINQLLDNGHLNNLPAGIVSKGLKLQGGKYGFRPGEWKMAQHSGERIGDHIFPLPVNEPSHVLFSLLNMLVDSGEKIASTMDIMGGEMPGQNTKATVAMETVRQGSEVFNGIHKRLYKAFSKELRKIYKLTKENFDPEEYVDVLDDPALGKLQQSDFHNKLDIFPATDPSASSEAQRLIKVQALMEGLQLGLPVEVVKRRYLEATEQPNIEELMQPPPPPPPDPEIEMKKVELQIKQAELAMEQEKTQAEIIKILASVELEGNKFDLERVKEMRELITKDSEDRRAAFGTLMQAREADNNTKEVEDNGSTSDIGEG